MMFKLFWFNKMHHIFLPHQLNDFDNNEMIQNTLDEKEPDDIKIKDLFELQDKYDLHNVQLVQIMWNM